MIKKKFTLVILGLVLSLLVVEVQLRLASFIYTKVQQRNIQKRLNSTDEYRILTLGESTTAPVLYETEDVSWPRQLEEVLNKTYKEKNFVVINKGVPSFKTRDIVENLDSYLENYRPHMVVAMIGVNDSFSNFDKEYQVVLEDENVWYEHAKIYKLAKLLQQKLIGSSGEDLSYVKKPKVLSLRDEISSHSCSEPEECIRMAETLIEVEDYKEAEALLNRAKNLGADVNRVGQILLVLGEKYEKKRMYEDAVRVYLVVEEWGSPLYEAHLKLSELYKETKNPTLRLYKDGPGLNRETQSNYRKIRDRLISEGIPLVAVQYPLREVDYLKETLGGDMEKQVVMSAPVFFVDNEEVFREKIKKDGYSEYFIDKFAGDFGHTSEKGHRILAENVADTIIREVFEK